MKFKILPNISHSQSLLSSIALLMFAAVSAWLAFHIYTGANTLYSKAKETITQQQTKKDALAMMMEVARERTIILLKMYVKTDVFERDELTENMRNEAVRFIKSREIIEGSELTNEEKVAFDELMRLININSPIQMKVAELLNSDLNHEAHDLLFDHAVPNQLDILNKFDVILGMVESETRGEVSNLENIVNTTNKRVFQLVFLVIVGTLASLVIMYFRSISRERILEEVVEQRTQALAQANRRTNSLIENSSDGIVTIDSHQNIVMFNPAAETMFQYSAKDVLEKPFSILLPDGKGHVHTSYVNAFAKDTGLQARMMDARPEVMGRRKDGSLFPAEVSISKSNSSNDMCFTAFVRDITERQEAEAEIRRLAMIDTLTGLSNRHHFETSLEKVITYQKRFPKNRFSLMLIDLDLFKQVNDTYGHPVGDRLLKLVADTLINNVRDIDCVGRLGGDEFAIILHGKDGETAVAKKLIQALSQPYEIDGYTIKIGASIGVASCPMENTDTTALFKLADKMLYEAKAAGRNTFRIS